MEYRLTPEMLKEYEEYLRLEERSEGTIQKYVRDLYGFYNIIDEKKIVNKEAVIAYKEHLGNNYAVSTANSMLASLNGFFVFMGWHGCKVKPYRFQRKVYRDKERELTKQEYLSLLRAARTNGNERLFYIMETLCATGIRISELPFITVEAVETGMATVRGKGKLRTVLIPKKLQRALQKYYGSRGIRSGAIFVTRTGNPMSRSNIWMEMKKLCKSAHVEETKVFPHNFRHLFAVTFYNLEKDIAKLADLLGHTSIETTRIYIMESGIAHERMIGRMGLVI